MRFLPIVLLLGILANTFCVLFFRLKLDRDYERRFEFLSDTLYSQVTNFSSSALSLVDSYLISNRNYYASSPSSRSSYSSVPDSLSDNFFSERGSWSYDFYFYDGSPVAKVGVVYFHVGDLFPRGGRITSIFPDLVVVDDSFVFFNSSFKLHDSFNDNLLTYKYGGSNYVSAANTMR